MGSMPNRGIAWALIGVLVAAAAWWVLGSQGETPGLQGSTAEAQAEDAPTLAEPRLDDGSATRDEVEVAEVPDHDHGHGGFGLGDLVEAVAEQVWQEPQRTVMFSGEVWADGQPVPGAEVMVGQGWHWGGPANEDELERKTVLCNAAGQFTGEFTLPMSGALEFIPMAPGLAAKDRLLVDSVVQSPVAGLRLELFPAHDLHGSVVQQDGLPVEGATVEIGLTDQWSRTREGTVQNTTYAPLELGDLTTAADGLYRHTVAEGMYQLSAKHEEHGEASLWSKAASDSPHELKLSVREEDPKTRILGRVHGPDGQPIAGAKLIFATEGPRTDTDENGEFVLDGVEAHWALAPELLAWAEGCAPIGIPLGELQPVMGPIRIDLAPGGKIAGVVLDEEGEPASGQEVRVVGLRMFADGRTPQRNLASIFGKHDETRSTADGRFSFEHLPAGEYTVIAGDESFRPEAAVMATTGSEGVVLQLGQFDAPLLDVEGRVVRAHDGQPLAGVTVQAHWVSRTGSGGWSASSVRDLETDQDGRYRGTGLPLGEYYFEAVLDGYARGKTDPVVESAGLKQLDFQLYAERTVRILVRDQDDNPIPQARITIRDAKGKEMMIWSGGGSGRTPANADEQGLLVAHRMPGGPCTVHVSASGKQEKEQPADWSADIDHEVVIVLEDA